MDALHLMPAALANQIMACHWMAQGIELEPMGKTYHHPAAATSYSELSNRPKLWALEPL
jgi:hypothetical protein